MKCCNPFVLLACLVGLLSGAAAAGAGSDGAAGNAPAVVLSGERDSELAPHGQGNVYAPDVHFDGNLYRMWYGGQGRDGHDRIHYAESTDGLTWSRKGVVLEDATANHVNDPAVVKVGGVYFMYYTRTKKDVVDRIDLAVSKDGRAWEPRGVALDVGPEGAWDGLSVGRPSVIYEDGMFRMWYDGRKDFPPDAPVRGVPKSSDSHRGVGYATSSDGIHFTRRGAGPVLGNDAGAVDVKRMGPQLMMVYESREGTRFATSKDLVTWSDRGLLVGRSETKLDAFGHVTPCLLVDPDGHIRRLYVGAAAAATWDHNCIVMLNVALH